MKNVRLCKVKDKLGYFHCWEHYSNVIVPSPMIGGHPGGTISCVYAIIEFEDGVKRIKDISSIKFCDEDNAILSELNKPKNCKNCAYCRNILDTETYTTTIKCDLLNNNFNYENGICDEYKRRIKKRLKI